MKPSDLDDSLRCSFCHKTEDQISKLIASPPNYPRAYICDECVVVCYSILKDERQHGTPLGHPASK